MEWLLTKSLFNLHLLFTFFFFFFSKKNQAQASAKGNFDETVEAHARLGVDARKMVIRLLFLYSVVSSLPVGIELE